MKEIHIECAGAGKTYGIAQKIVSMLDDCPRDKKIYVITYTNYAVKQIKDELKKTVRDIPNNVVIDTVHGFLLNNIIYSYSKFVKGEAVNSCSIEKLSSNPKWQANHKRMLKNAGVIHAHEVSQYAKSILVATKSDSVAIKKRKEIAVNYFTSDIYCLFVDEAQDMDGCFFEFMLKIICKLENFYFVGDPFQTLWGTDKYEWFTEEAEKQEGITRIINTISRRIPSCIVPLCNRILPQDLTLSSCNTESGLVAYILLSELDVKIRRQLRSDRNVFSYIKAKTDLFSTANEQVGLTHEFIQVLAEKYPQYDIGALRCVAISQILRIGLDNCLKRHNIRLSNQGYARLASQFSNDKCSGIYVESIQKIKGLEGDSAYFIVCNSLLEILLGLKNDLNKETKLLYVALTRAKRRLLLVIDDDEHLINNFKKYDVNINSALVDLGIQKAIIEDWFTVTD